MSEKQIYGYKRVQVIPSINFFLSHNFTPLHVSFYNNNFVKICFVFT